MEVLEEVCESVMKKQRLCVAQIERQLDDLLEHVESTQLQLENRQQELYRKKNHQMTTSSTSESEICDNSTTTNAATRDPRCNEIERGNAIVRDFVERVRQLNVEKNVASELKEIHVVLAKYSKQIDKSLCTDIAKICRANELDPKRVCRLVVDHLYQDGQIEAADVMCKEAGLEQPTTLRECFIDLNQILKALKVRDVQPALTWARQHRKDLVKLNMDLEFELLRLKYVDILEFSPDMMEAIDFANKELSGFHKTHSEEIGVLMSCVLYKGKLEESPYKKLFSLDQWSKVYDTINQAFCWLHRVPHQSYLDTCLRVGVPALPAMRKLASVMDSKLADWNNLEELPVEIPIAKEFRFHSVFSCPVSKEESTPENPPVLLKCGHVICHSCVKRISYNLSRQFKCPTCPVEQTESDTCKLIF
ncbi:hypothetical protein CCR75_004680 [Bremia lactucae]|uniref:Uncharacterized protein n=1 Tax=Bremia lactucae TaxID=4779 RepID=A0A976FQJ4_BRELC|nr:hypothetical protein CCR75_004680 [Bremia lactucae]